MLKSNHLPKETVSIITEMNQEIFKLPQQISEKKTKFILEDFTTGSDCDVLAMRHSFSLYFDSSLEIFELQTSSSNQSVNEEFVTEMNRMIRYQKRLNESLGYAGI